MKNMREQITQISPEQKKNALLQEYNNIQNDGLRDLRVRLSNCKSGQEREEISSAINKLEERSQKIIDELGELKVKSGFGFDQPPYPPEFK
jgi:primosomal protein N''